MAISLEHYFSFYNQIFLLLNRYFDDVLDFLNFWSAFGIGATVIVSFIVQISTFNSEENPDAHLNFNK